MYNRIKVLRKTLNLSQDEFAEKLGLTRGSISLIEIGKNALTEQNIKLICLIFCVNEEWLRTGNGDIFASSPLEKELLENFNRLSLEMQNAILNHVKTLLDVQQTK